MHSGNFKNQSINFKAPDLKVNDLVTNIEFLKRLERDKGPHFSAVSPLEYRYDVPKLREYLSEEASIFYKLKVELAIILAYHRIGKAPAFAVTEVIEAIPKVSAKQVYEEEAKTHHDIIALVNVLKKNVSDDTAKFVHRAATSFDIIDSANAMRYKDAFNDVITPDSAKLLRAFIKVAENEANTLQIGRTHLQHAEPITFGFAIAWFADRFGGRLIKSIEASKALVGKFSGAVGAYNAAELFVPDPIAFEQDVMNLLGLQPASISTQILPPEYVSDLMHFVTTSFGVLANFSQDMRNLMRPEINEIDMPRGKDVSRSSTMANKKNPVGLENIQSLYWEILPKEITMYLNLISENQRDLTNSASQRFTPESFFIFDYAVRRATGIADKLVALPDAMRKNLDMNANTIVAEPLQLLLASCGMPDAHKLVGELSDLARLQGRNVVDLAWEDERLRPYMERLTPEQRKSLGEPEGYTGKAEFKALERVEAWKSKLNALGL